MSDTIDLARLRILGDERRQAVTDLEDAHRAALNEAVAILDAGGDAVRVTELARLAGVNRATIYNELKRRRNGAGGGH